MVGDICTDEEQQYINALSCCVEECGQQEVIKYLQCCVYGEIPDLNFGCFHAMKEAIDKLNDSLGRENFNRRLLASIDFMKDELTWT